MGRAPASACRSSRHFYSAIGAAVNSSLEILVPHRKSSSNSGKDQLRPHEQLCFEVVLTCRRNSRQSCLVGGCGSQLKTLVTLVYCTAGAAVFDLRRKGDPRDNKASGHVSERVLVCEASLALRRA